MKAFSSIKTVLRQLRYLELTPLIGSLVRIDSLASLEHDVRVVLQNHGINYLGQLRTTEDEFHFCLKKYRLLDLQFDVLPPLPTTNSIDVHFLKKYGFLDDADDLNTGPILPGCDDAGLLSMLIDDINKDEWCLKVFLRDPELNQAIANQNLPDLAKSFDPSTFFPRAIPVSDACVTNCGSVWFFKHFYM